MKSSIDLITHIREAFANLIGSKLRSMLAVLGVLVGTASVVAMVSSGELATHKALEQFKELGTDLFSISLFAKSEEGRANLMQFDENKALGLKKISKHIKGIAPYSTAYAPINYESHRISGSVVGVTQSLQDIIKIKIKSGRFISDLDAYNNYCVIGDKVFQKIKKLSTSNPLGKQINLGDTVFTIVGVADKWQENGFFFINNFNRRNSI